MTKPYRQLEHAADLRIRITGSSLPDLLKNAVYAFCDQVVDAAKVHPKRKQRIVVAAVQPDLLLFGLLKECLFRFDARRFVARDLQKISVDENGLEAVLVGETLSPRHATRAEIKAVTLHGLNVVHRSGRWTADVIFDL